MSQGGQPLGDGAEPIEPQRVHGQASEGGHDLDAVGLAVAVVVLLELGIAGPVPGVLAALGFREAVRPTVTHVTQLSLRASAQTRDVVTGLVGWLAIAAALTARGDPRGAARPGLRHPLGSRHRPERPGEVPAVLALALAGLQRCLPATDQANLDHLKALVATVFEGIPLRGSLTATESRRHAAGGRGKRTVGMQRVRLGKQPLELHTIQQQAQRHNLTTGIGGEGALGDGHTQAVGVKARLGDEIRCAGSGFID